MFKVRRTIIHYVLQIRISSKNIIDIYRFSEKNSKNVFIYSVFRVKHLVNVFI